MNTEDTGLTLRAFDDQQPDHHTLELIDSYAPDSRSVIGTSNRRREGSSWNAHRARFRGLHRVSRPPGTDPPRIEKRSRRAADMSTHCRQTLEALTPYGEGQTEYEAQDCEAASNRSRSSAPRPLLELAQRELEMEPELLRILLEGNAMLPSLEATPAVANPKQRSITRKAASAKTGFVPKGQFPFLKLPGEIRNQIYECVLTTDRAILIWGNTWTVEDREDGAAAGASTLFRLCKQIYQESEEFLYQNNFLVDFFFTPILNFEGQGLDREPEGSFEIMQNVARTIYPGESWTQDFPMRRLHDLSVPVHKIKTLTLRLRGPYFPFSPKFTGRRYMTWTSQLFLDASAKHLPDLVNRATELRTFRIVPDGWAHRGSRDALNRWLVKMWRIECRGAVEWVQKGVESGGDWDEVYLGEVARQVIVDWTSKGVTFSVK